MTSVASLSLFVYSIVDTIYSLQNLIVDPVDFLCNI
jgi:hypothetical protein